MIEITIDMTKEFPSYLTNWSDQNLSSTAYTSYDDAVRIFHETTNGYIVGTKGHTKYTMMFERDEDYTFFLLRYS